MGGGGFSKIKISFSRAFWSAIFFDHDDDFLRLKLSILRLGTLFDHRGATFSRSVETFLISKAIF